MQVSLRLEFYSEKDEKLWLSKIDCLDLCYSLAVNFETWKFPIGDRFDIFCLSIGYRKSSLVQAVLTRGKFLSTKLNFLEVPNVYIVDDKRRT
jgi:hypothetical protein